MKSALHRSSFNQFMQIRNGIKPLLTSIRTKFRYKIEMKDQSPLTFVLIKFCTTENEIGAPPKVVLNDSLQFHIRITWKLNQSKEDCATQCQSPFPRDDDSQEETRKTMPTALYRDDESSNPGSKQEIVLRVE